MPLAVEPERISCASERMSPRAPLRTALSAGSIASGRSGLMWPSRLKTTTRAHRTRPRRAPPISSAVRERSVGPCASSTNARIAESFSEVGVRRTSKPLSSSSCA